MRASLIGILVACWAFSAQPAVAANDRYSSANAKANKATYNASKKSKRKKISSSQAANIVKSRFGGKILKVKSTSSGYRVKVLQKNGRISSVFVDGNSGRIGG